MASRRAVSASTSSWQSRLLIFAALSATGFVLAVVLVTAWRIGSRSDGATLRLAAQGQLIVAAVALVPTFVLAFTTIYYANQNRRMVHEMQQARRLEEERRADEREDRLASQARLVAAWSTDTTGGEPDWSPDAPAGQVIRRVSLRVLNASAVPVYNCTVLVRADWGDDPAEYVATAAGYGLYRAVLPPGELTETVPAVIGEDLLTQPPVDVVFTDAGGWHWHRRGDGTLRQLDENPGGVC